MLEKLWNKISYTGTSRIENISEKRNIVISNRLVTGIFLLNILLYFFMITFGGPGPLSNMMIAGNFISYFTILGLTQSGYNILARILFSLMVSVFTFSTTIMSKIDASQIWDDQFYSPRFYITMTAIIPILIFSSKDRWALIFSLSGSFLTLLLFDPIHNYFGVGYYQSGHYSESYPFFTVITMAGYLIIVISLIGYRRVIERYERDQAESSTALAEKNAIIEEQKEQLEQSNVELDSELREKNKELIKSVSELRQFSYTLSHNLRSPVASLLGLVNLIKANNSDLGKETKDVLTHIKKSAQDLDETISDLSKILEIRDDIEAINEEVDVGVEIDKVLAVLNEEVSKHNVQIEVASHDLSVINSVRAYIHSILYNLISNAIKFRVPEGEHKIDIHTSQDEANVRVSIKDNGIGMDLDRYGDQLFKMYKKLNLHTSGKGLGLYIANYQIEALKGSIEVSSAPGKGTTFIVNFPR